jgi:hypothetical protein
MNRTFNTIKSNVGLNVGDSSISMINLIGTYINNRMMEIYRRCNIVDINRSDYQFTTTAGTEDYILPQDFGKELSVRDATNNILLSRSDAQESIMRNPDDTDTQGSVRRYVIMDKTVRNQPTSASVVSFVSTSASDTSQTIYVKGFDANGYEDYDQVTIAGTTTASTTKSFIRILYIAKSSTSAGVITGTTNSGAVTVAVLSRAMLEHRVKMMRLVNIQNTAVTIEVNYIQKPMPLSSDYDYPIIDCADILEAGAEADAWRFKRQFSKAADLDIIFEKKLANLQFDYENQPNSIRTFRPRTYSANSDFGNINDARYGIF